MSEQRKANRLKAMNSTIQRELKEFGISRYGMTSSAYKYIEWNETRKKMFNNHEINLQDLKNFYILENQKDFYKAIEQYIWYFTLYRILDEDASPEYDVEYDEKCEKINICGDYCARDIDFMDFESMDEKKIEKLEKEIGMMGYKEDLEQVAMKRIFDKKEANLSLVALFEQVETEIKENILLVEKDMKERIDSIIQKVQSIYAE